MKAFRLKTAYSRVLIENAAVLTSSHDRASRKLFSSTLDQQRSNLQCEELRFPVTVGLFSCTSEPTLHVKEIGCLSFDEDRRITHDSKKSLKVLKNIVISRPVYFDRISDSSRRLIHTSGKSAYQGLLEWICRRGSNSWYVFVCTPDIRID